MLDVRSMTEEDITAVAELEKATFTDAWTLEGIRDTFFQKQTFVIVAEESGNLKGYCIVYYVMDEGEIARIAVDETCRRQGVGRKILDYVSKICSEKGIDRMMLDVRESNQTARGFYRNYGFEEDGIRKDFYERPKEDAILMSKVVG